MKIQYNRNRYYDYYTGRWLTYDPLGYVDGLNLYEYPRSNPVILVDPSGLGGCAKPPPCKCFCLHDLRITSGKTRRGPLKGLKYFVGAVFTVEMTGEWKDADCLKPFKFEWWEWYVHPGEEPFYSGLPPRNWNKIFPGPASSHPFFAPLKTVSNTYTLTDEPGNWLSGGSNITQEAHIVIQASGAKGCCRKVPKIGRVYASQRFHARRAFGGPFIHYNKFRFSNAAPLPGMPQPLPPPIGE